MQQFVVGPNATIPNGIAYARLAAAKQKLGDFSMWQDVSIKVDPGKGYGSGSPYINDTWWITAIARNFTLDGTGSSGVKSRILNQLEKGMPYIQGLPFSGVAGDKGLVWAAGEDMTLRGFEIEGARTQNGNNGAGIRLDGGTNMTLENMTFRYNQNGVLISPRDNELTTEDERGDIIMRAVEFSNNGLNGQAHNLYCGATRSLFVEDSVFTTAVSQGNTFKTRADDNTVRYSTLTTGNGYNSYVYDAMGGKNLLQYNTFQNLERYTSQKLKCVHIYIEPPSKPVELDIQWNVFDCRGFQSGRPIFLDPRVLYNGTGAIGEDGEYHRKGENYFVDGDERDMEGIIDNNVILIGNHPRRHFGYDPLGGPDRIAWTPAGIAFPPSLRVGPNNRFVVVDPRPAEEDESGQTNSDGCNEHHHHRKHNHEFG